MKVLVLLAGIVALAVTASVKVKHPKFETETPDYHYMQKVVLQLFKNVYQPNYYPELEKVGTSYNFEASSQYYTNPKYVLEFLEHDKYGFLPKGQVFSIFYTKHQKEAIAFFRVLYSAVDFDTFYKTACWGRMHLNEALYMYALSVALAHRPDTWQLQLPPIYEMYPFYFYNAEALQKVHQHFFKGDYTSYFKPTGQQMPYYNTKSQYPQQYNQKYGSYPYQMDNSYPKSYQWTYGQTPYQKTQYPGQYGQYQYQQDGDYPKSYPMNYKGYPYEKSQYPGQYEQYLDQQSEYYPKSNQMNYKSYPYKYGQYPYEKTGQYEQYPYQQGQYYQQKSEYPYGQYPYFKSQYPGQYQPYTYNKSYPYQMNEHYPYGKTPYSYEQTQYTYGKTQYPQGKTPYFYEPGQYPYGKSPYSYEKTQYPYGKTPSSYEMNEYPSSYQKGQYPYQEKYQYSKTYPQDNQYESSKSFYPEWLDQMMYMIKQQSQPEEYYPQERENVPEYYNKDNFEGITIDYEYNTENPLFYFTEDVGMNAFYYYYHIYFPFWMTNEEIIYKTEFRGEQYYYFYQQLLARYNLERLSNSLGEIPLMDWDGFVHHGFESHLAYPNGLMFPDRPDHAPITPRWEVSMQCYDNITLSVTNIKAYEHRIFEAIDSGFVLTRHGKFVSIFEPEGFEILGNLIQANPESPNARYYGNVQVLARFVLGYAKYPIEKYPIAPSVLEHFETSLRDPAFYQLYKRVIYYFQRYKQYLPEYTQEELYMPGVKIEDVTVDKLITYFDYFYSDISSFMQGNVEGLQVKDTPIRLKQYRLNHQPFNYRLSVNSEKPYEAVIRVFLGPKYDQYGKPYSINHNRLNFVEFDRFAYSLVSGVNTIERNSRQSFFAHDRTSYRELYMQVLNVQSTSMYETTPTHVSWSMPQRMLLPKGSKEGQSFQMYFIITPVQGVPEKTMKYSKYTPKYTTPKHTPTLFWDHTFDKLPFGYPFDRPIEEAYFFVPNSYFKDVVIYNEGFGEPK